MLLNLAIQNWMSYYDEATLSLTASLERQHARTLSKIPGFRSKKALPLAAIYGGNASGKTGVLNALRCIKKMILSPATVNKTVPVIPFFLNSKVFNEPTVFDITFLMNDNVYRWVVEATRKTVLYESLEIVKENKIIDIYERDTQENTFEYNDDFFTKSDHIEYVAATTRDNQVFFGNAVSQNVVELNEAYDWFDEVLELVGVESQAWTFANCANGIEGFLQFAGRVLNHLDTGIVALKTEPTNLERLIAEADLQHDIDELKPDEVITLVGNRSMGDYGFELAMIHLENGRPVAEALNAIHADAGGNEHSIPLLFESSGTQRLLGLLPMLFELVNPSNDEVGQKVYVVDELDRCFHTMLTSYLIEHFSDSCNADTRKQLLFTTHDLLLMDQSLMRRDEMYVAQRRIDGCSELIGLNEYKDIRFDKDLIKSYLEGRFGGIPMFSDSSDEVLDEVLSVERSNAGVSAE